MNKLRKYMETSPFTIASKKNEELRSKLNENVNDLYKENYKPLKKEIRNTAEGGKISCANGLVEST
jgi:hypothetical protein